MNVMVIGASNMGRGIGTRLVAGGHRVTLVDRNPEKARNLAGSLDQGSAGMGSATTGQLEAIQDDVTVLAVGYGANVALVRQLGAALAGKIVVDIANPIDFATFTLATAPGTSSAEEVPGAVARSKVAKSTGLAMSTTILPARAAPNYRTSSMFAP